MICRICKSNRIEWKGKLSNLTHTKCESCGAINSYIYDWTCNNCGQTHSTENPYCDCEEQENQIES